jgi:hypothetical protein
MALAGASGSERRAGVIYLPFTVSKQDAAIVNLRFTVSVVFLLMFFRPAASNASQPPLIQYNRTKGTVDVVGLDPAELGKLTGAALSTDQWQRIFAVHVQKEKGETTNPIAVLGSYQVDHNVVRFQPRFPLTPGVRYRAILDRTRISGHNRGNEQPIVAEIDLPKPAKAPTVVQQVYPSGDQLPENQLRFYIYFSAPMHQGSVYEHIQLLDAAGKALDHPFLELDEELWDPQGKRFTLLFHPGRIKKGLKPREELGPILEAGKSYTLVIDPQWTDAGGNPLKAAFRKSFRAVAAEEKSPDPRTWRIQPPSAGGVLPLTVIFPRPLDYALLQRMLWITDVQQRRVPGTVAFSEHEMRWHFTPERPWQAGSYSLVVDTRLEDSAGNSIHRPFEVDVFHPIERQVTTETISLAFQVLAASPR